MFNDYKNEINMRTGCESIFNAPKTLYLLLERAESFLFFSIILNILLGICLILRW